MKKTYALIYALTLLFGCSKNNGLVDDTDNNAPIIKDQNFEINENAENGTVIGTVMAVDADGDLLSFSIKSNTNYGVSIEEKSGVLKVSNVDFFDSQEETLSLPIQVTDGFLTSKANITINILDVDERFLSDNEKEFMEVYHYITYNLSPTSFGSNFNEKWNTTLKLFLDGNITTSYKDDITAAIESFNSHFSDGFKIELTEDKTKANVNLIVGPVEDIQTVWPDIYDVVTENGFFGYARYTSDGKYHMNGGQIWLKDHRIPVFKHEIGHIIGLGHPPSTYCTKGSNKSIMCSFPADDFSEFDKGILKLLYHPDIEVGKSFEELKPTLEKLILNEIVSF